ncbi:MAG TPA: hypothetical protein VI461_01495, partial [Chitinophagaceae bacterium]|nr:hypothetical protein [Chitinophagaceae bacterium]
YWHIKNATFNTIRSRKAKLMRSSMPSLWFIILCFINFHVKCLQGYSKTSHLYWIKTKSI